MAIPVLERVPRRRRRSLRLFAPRFLPLLAVLLAAAAAAVTFAVRDHAYRGEVLPGVRVLGVDLSGSSRAEAMREIEAAGRARLDREVTIVVAGHRVRAPLNRLFRLDAAATADAALAAGRASNAARVATLLAPVPPTRRVEPIVELRRIAAGVLVEGLNRLGTPAVPATVRLHRLDPVVVPGRAGRVVSEHALFDALRAGVLTGSTTVVAHFRRSAPPIPNAAALEAAEIARKMVAAPVSLRFRAKRLGSLSPARLAALVRFVPAGRMYAVSLAPAPLLAAVRPLVARWRHAPANARFETSGSSVAIVPSKPGYDLDPAAVVRTVTAAARSTGDRSAAVVLERVPAAFTTREAQALGIRRQLVSFTTEMGPSSANRIHNVHLMADYIDGTIIRPGEVFSFNRVVGPRTPQRGFLEGQMIVGSLLLPAIGGGVCQTATTLFNDAFQAGLPILERHNHGFFISHYPLGRDATVSWGGPDLKFRNDLKHGILIDSSYTDSTLTFTFYGTPQGRTVTATTSPQTRWTAPKMSYALDPNAPPGSARVVSGTGESGFDVTVERTVREHGRVLRKDSFFSRYTPVGPTTIYGPGAKHYDFVLPK
jgi:vancomycin resistance protein YoaR